MLGIAALYLESLRASRQALVRTEAVVLADRVVVMSPRPGRIQEIIEIGLPRPRSFETEATPEFHEASQRIRQLIFGTRHVGPGRAAA